MPIPSSITDLNAVAASNSPSGSDSPIDGDNFIRAHAAFIRQLYDGTGSAAAALTDLASTADAAKGDALIGVKRTASGAVATTQHAWHEKQPANPVTDFAADNTGVADASSAFQSALNTGMDVVVPPGTYKITTPLTFTTAGQAVRGIGRPTLKASVNGKHIISANNLANVTLVGVLLEGTGSATVPTDSIGGLAAANTGLATFVGCSDVHITECEAYNFQNGFTVYNGDRVWFCGNRVRNWLLYGVVLSLCTDFICDYNVIIGCDQTGAANAYGVTATGDETAGASSVQKSCSISHNVIRGIPSWDGVMTHDVSGLRIVGNDIRDVRTGLDIGHINSNNFVRDIQIANNFIESTATNTWGGTAALHAGIYVSGFDATHLVDGVVISGNIVKGFFVTSGMVGAGNPSHIVASFCKRAAVNANIVKDGGNVMSNAGIYVVGNNDGAAVIGNVLQGTMSAGGVRFASVVADSATIIGNTIKQTTTTDSAVQVTGSTITSFACDANAHNSTIPFVQSTSTLTQANSGVFTATLTGCTTSPTASCKWVLNGNMVTLTVPALSATSNATTCTLTGLSSFLQPFANTVVCPILAQDSGAFTNNITAGIAAGSGTITLSRAGSTTGWTNSGTKGPFESTITYALN